MAQAQQMTHLMSNNHRRVVRIAETIESQMTVVRTIFAPLGNPSTTLLKERLWAASAKNYQHIETETIL